MFYKRVTFARWKRGHKPSVTHKTLSIQVDSEMKLKISVTEVSLKWSQENWNNKIDRQWWNSYFSSYKEKNLSKLVFHHNSL